MGKAKKVLVFGAAGRVGLDLVKTLLRHKINVTAVDFVDQKRMSEMLSRVVIDARLDSTDATPLVNVYGNFDVLNGDKVSEILTKEKPDIVVNYAIPFTWDAAKRLPNYNKISQAGLGAFAAVQVLAPKIIAQSLAESGCHAKFIVGNLPDITIPIIYALKKHHHLILPIGGAGNVGLIEAGLKYEIAMRRRVDMSDLQVFLVAHHVHWVVPREPGYQNDAPFLLKVHLQGEDITQELGDLRKLMNKAITNCYEAGAGFSSTTAILASRLVLSLFEDNEKRHRLHVPAPNGLPGGYPVTVKDGDISLDLPLEWKASEAINMMKQAHKRDGIDKIGEDGSIHFTLQSVAILKEELSIELPEVVKPSDLERVAKEQIRIAQNAILAI